jgi:hypothetical protein
MNLRNLQKYAITKNFFEEFKHEQKRSSHQSLSSTSVKDNDKPKLQVKTGVGTHRHNVSERQTHQSLFWAFYSLVNVDFTPQIKEQHGFKLKNDYAMAFIENLKKNKTFLKEHKLKFHDIEASLLYDEDISLSTLKALVLFNKMNVIYIWNNKYYIFVSNDEDTIFHMIKRTRNKHEQYTMERDLEKEFILKKETHGKLLMEDIRTQLKTLSSYKLNELKMIAEILGISLEQKKTKQVIYEEINSKID